MARKRLPSVVQRARRIARRRFRRDFGERFLKGLGFDSSEFRQGGLVKGKLGLFGGAIARSIPGQSGPGAQPNVEQPERVTNENNPSITTIIGQLDKLVKTAKKVGILSKEQQDALLGQIAQARRISKEQILENKPTAIPVPTEVSGGDALTPLSTVIDELREQLKKLTGTVEDKNEENEKDSNNRGFAERFFDSYDMGDEYRTRRRRRQARAQRVTRDQLLDKNGNPLRGAARDSRIRKINADRAARAQGNIFTRMFKRTPGVTATATATSSGIARTMGQGIARSTSLVRAGTSGVKSAVRRIAAPIITKGLAKTALKSIPIVGAVAGAGFAVDRLLKGDVIGAGLDLASGLGGPLTAIPALVATTARDVYSGVFGVQPESDPQFGSRMGTVTGAVEGLVKEQLSGTVDVKDKPSQSAIDRQTIPPTPPQAPPQRETGPSLSATPPTPPAPTAPSSSGAPSSSSAPAPAASAATTPEPAAAATPEASATPVTSAPTTGADIATASTAPIPVQLPNLYGFNQSEGRFLPQTSPMSRNGHIGIGEVPNPDYIPSGHNNLPMLYNVMFFNVNYQEQ